MLLVKDYQITYKDHQGNSYSFDLMSTDVRTAMTNAFELRPEIKQIVRCVQKPMFSDNEETSN